MVVPSAIRPRPDDNPAPARNGHSGTATANGTHAPAVDPNAYPYVDVPELCYSDWLKATDGEVRDNKPTGGIGYISEEVKSKNQDTVLIIGSGVSGASAAYELAKIGVDVTVVDAENEIGGRAASTKIPCNPESSKNLIELGAMRFPASESIMDHYVQKFKILGGNSFTNKENIFPDPGKVPTIFATDGVVNKTIYWDKQYGGGDTNKLPKEFEKVYKGWIALIDQPLKRFVGGDSTPKTFANQLDGSGVLPSLKQLLQNRNVSEAQAQWQIWIDQFEQTSFYGAMFEIFTGRNGWVIPGDEETKQEDRAWTPHDFDLFGQLGVGSGGFGSLYPINFVEIIRLIINGLESTQYFFPPGIRTLPKALLNAAQGKDERNPVITKAKFHKNVFVTKVNGCMLSGFTIETKQSNPVEDIRFNRVIVATTIRSMECTMNVASAMKPEVTNEQTVEAMQTEVDNASKKQTAGQLISSDTATAVRRVHTSSSIKVAAQIKKFWDGQQPDDFPRCFLSDDIVKQVYTLEYEHDANDPTAVCFLTYTWDDDAIRQQGLGITLDSTVDESQGIQGQTYSIDKRKLYMALHKRMQYLVNQNPDNKIFASFVDGLYPYVKPNAEMHISDNPKKQNYPENAILYVEWQSLPTYNAAFKLSEPGQDHHVREMFYDYQKAGTDTDTGVYLAGDTLAWTAGWIEGGLYTGLNAAAGIIKSIGGKVSSQTYRETPTKMKGNPMELNPRQFNYFPAGIQPLSKR